MERLSADGLGIYLMSLELENAIADVERSYDGIRKVVYGDCNAFEIETTYQKFLSSMFKD